MSDTQPTVNLIDTEIPTAPEPATEHVVEQAGTVSEDAAAAMPAAHQHSESTVIHNLSVEDMAEETSGGPIPPPVPRKPTGLKLTFSSPAAAEAEDKGAPSHPLQGSDETGGQNHHSRASSIGLDYQPKPEDVKSSSATVKVAPLVKQKFATALQSYLTKRGVMEQQGAVSSPEDKPTALPTKKLLGFINATQRQTSDKKAELAKAAYRKQQSSDNLRILALAIIAEDITIEEDKYKIKQQEGGVSRAAEIPAALLAVPDYNQKLTDYLANPDILTLDITTHPNPKRGELFKAMYGLLDDLAPAAKACAAFIEAFRKQFKIAPSGKEFTSKYTHVNDPTSAMLNKLVVATYKSLIQVKNQTLEQFRNILFNLFALERRLLEVKANHQPITADGQFSEYFNKLEIKLDASQDLWREFTQPSDQPHTVEARYYSLGKLLERENDKPDMEKISKPRRRGFFSSPMTEIEQFVRLKIEEIDNKLEIQPKFAATSVSQPQ